MSGAAAAAATAANKATDDEEDEIAAVTGAATEFEADETEVAGEEVTPDVLLVEAMGADEEELPPLVREDRTPLDLVPLLPLLPLLLLLLPLLLLLLLLL